MRYRCAVENLEFHAYHGLHKEEKLTGGLFVVDVSVELEKADQEGMKDLKEVINYEGLFKMIKIMMDEPEGLIETVAKKILDKVAGTYHQVTRIEVKITKPDPAGLFKSGHAAVTLIYDGD